MSVHYRAQLHALLFQPLRTLIWFSEGVFTLLHRLHSGCEVGSIQLLWIMNSQVYNNLYMWQVLLGKDGNASDSLTIIVEGMSQPWINGSESVSHQSLYRKHSVMTYLTAEGSHIINKSGVFLVKSQVCWEWWSPKSHLQYTCLTLTLNSMLAKYIYDSKSYWKVSAWWPH